VAIQLDLTLRVDVQQHDPREVVRVLQADLLESFSVRRRSLGQDLYTSDVYRSVERTVGVENATCILQGDSSIGRIEAASDVVLYLDPGGAGLRISHEEYRP
jgi:hypothetical protein